MKCSVLESSYEKQGFKIGENEVTTPDGQVVSRGFYNRMTEPIKMRFVAGPRKSSLIFALDQYGLPWSWGASESLLEENLKAFDKEVYEAWLADNPPNSAEEEKRIAELEAREERIARGEDSA